MLVLCHTQTRRVGQDRFSVSGTMTSMAKAPPDSTKTSLRQRLSAHARQHWPVLAELTVRYRGAFAYVDAVLPDGTVIALCRLRYVGYARDWGFAIYLASTDGYQDSYLPSGRPVGPIEEALDCACNLYLADPTIWQQPPTN